MKKLFVVLAILFAQIVFLNAQENKAPKPPKGYANMTLLKAAYFLHLLKLGERNPAIPAEIIEYKNITYKQTKSRPLKLDIYRLKTLPRPAPLLIFIHGGAWKKGDKSDYLRYLVDFAERGYVTATISYRFSQEAPFPAAVKDVKCAVRWLKAHAREYFINPEKIAVIGGSAGGHLAMMIGYSSDSPEFEDECPGIDSTITSRVQAVVNFYGPSNLASAYASKQPNVIKFIGKPVDEAFEEYVKASPITYLTKDDPPTLIFHGTIDELVPVAQSDSLKAALDRVGVAAEYHRLKGWPHTMDLALKVNQYCQYYMNVFFEKYLDRR
ncbi:MAG: alpha/beta hydrolase fold domain-containing protein [Actinobacteria bacterium]|nr:alpha/beta hydrolase fold domain-containing protein [Actinomycetota bacterium]